MYESFYNLRADPFLISPDHRFAFAHGDYARARSYLEYGLRRGEGIVLITGVPGTGKSTVVDDLLARYPEGYRHLAYLQSGLGYTVKRDMPGLRGDVVEALYALGDGFLDQTAYAAALLAVPVLAPDTRSADFAASASRRSFSWRAISASEARASSCPTARAASRIADP